MKRAIYLILFASSIKAQQLRVEAMPGNKNYWYQHVITTEFDSSRLGFLNTSSLQYFIRESNTELMTQSYLTYKLHSHIKLGLGSFYASQPGFKPSFNLQYAATRKNWSLFLIPRVDVWRKASYDLFLLYEYKPAISKDLKFYLRVQAMSNYRRLIHNRSYQLLRVGLQRKNIQFGIAANYDAYGEDMKYRAHYGLFIRK
jgi:hypothetical protein